VREDTVLAALLKKIYTGISHFLLAKLKIMNNGTKTLRIYFFFKDNENYEKELPKLQIIRLLKLINWISKDT